MVDNSKANEDFIERLRQRDERAFRTLVEQQKDRVYNTCLGFVRNPRDAEDLAQEVFIQVFESIDRFREEASISTWIYRIAVRKSLELIRYRRREKRRAFFESLLGLKEREEESEADSTYLHPGIALEHKERAEILFRAVDSLPENQKIAFTLHKVEGLSYREIAGVMETTVPAVEGLMHRAKNNLQKKLYAYYRQEH